MVLTTTKESELIECRECGFIFDKNNAEVCRICRESICPKCEACGCGKWMRAQVKPVR